MKIETSIYAYPWDLLDEGVEPALEKIAGLGVDTVHVAAAYHSGKFLLPHNPRRRIYFPEGGVTYFIPSGARFKDLAIQPVASELLAHGDIFGLISQQCRKASLKLVAWMVGIHNTRLATRYPRFAVRNAYGDPYIYALCPSHEEVRQYVSAIIEDLIEQHPLHAIEAESFGYMGFYHGYHHEFYLVNLGMFEQCLLALCFCPACEHLGREAGVDVGHLKSEVRAAVDRKVAEPVEHGKLEADSIAELLDFVASREALGAYLRKRCEVATRLTSQLTNLSHGKGVRFYVVGPVFIRPTALSWVEGLDVKAAGQVVDRFEVPLYFEEYDRKAAEAFRVAGLRLRSEVGAALNVGYLFTKSCDDLVASALLAKFAGMCAVGFYNYGTLPEYRLKWIEEAVKSLREGR